MVEQLESLPVEVWVLILTGFAAGAVIGALLVFVVARARGNSGDNRARLEVMEAEYANYRDQVDRHFDTTAELFRGLTTQYRAMHDHLSHSAQLLCGPDQVPPALNPDAVEQIDHSPTAPALDRDAPGAAAKAKGKAGAADEAAPAAPQESATPAGHDATDTRPAAHVDLGGRGR